MIRVTKILILLSCFERPLNCSRKPRTNDGSHDLRALEAATKSAQLSGDNAWMLISAALVLMMTGPGLALFYGGLVRRKNVLGTMMHSFILMAVVTVLWAIYGYSLAFARRQRRSSAIFSYLFLNGVGSRAQSPITPPPFRSRRS